MVGTLPSLGTISITGYKLATSFLKDTIYFCPFLERQGIFSYTDGHVMVVSETGGKNDPSQFSGSHRQKHQAVSLSHSPATFSSQVC